MNLKWLENLLYITYDGGGKSNLCNKVASCYGLLWSNIHVCVLSTFKLCLPLPILDFTE